MTRVVFLGTPDFAVPSLRSLVEQPEFNVVGVITQPDRPAGRGQRVQISPVKHYALDVGLPVLQPRSLRKSEAVDELRGLQPDLLVVAAFGQILKPNVLELGRYGSINVHASLLPRWRGAAPIQYAIREGDSETGVTVMLMDEGLDTGPMLYRHAVAIDPDETGQSLHDKLAAEAAEILPGVLLDYIDGALEAQPQPEVGVTYAPTLQKSDGSIDWEDSATAIDRQVRAYTPWPGTYTFLDGERLKILKGVPLNDAVQAAPGTLVTEMGQLAVQTGDGIYILDEVQPAGKKRMTGQAFLAGRSDAVGVMLQQDET
ncbi:MAG: methionyl-tRNA formyltransferase [Chloroflexi bacterium]|nr:methionyl-tRNA formyltransferase [Chloroflexota bacterium]